MPKLIPKTIKVPNPEYYTEERKRDRVANSGYAVEDFYPEDYGKLLPDDGGWIILLMSVRVGKQLPNGKSKAITVPHLSCWFALPKTIHNGMHLVTIQTPDGEVCVWPHEYNLFDVSKLLEFSDEDGFYTHFLSSDGGFDEQSMFYLRSRGIAKGEAQRMLLASLKDPHYCYFTFAKQISGYFGERFGTPYLHAHNHKRRARAHARRIG